MLTQETKRHIDAARQVLVGVVPNPSSQIDQITNALIYKFMDDMDQSAIKTGGDPSFFVRDLERYAWTRLMDSRIGNQDRMNLYSEALVKFSEAKQLPQLFRDIFKSAFLPYRSPEVLGLFLKEIDYFDYSHSEELGNAYEYLLSIMGSQGDAGQFRTPRHIIDFIVVAVNPTKDDKVLDPACGTAGFLVSAYKHILEQHDGKNSDGSKNNEKPLTPDQRKALMNNFEGYDVDPGMVRIAQVNMYLHHFRNPKIFSYNTLSQDERWADKFDVILANPPFMSPKGGVSTHNKFSVPSSRSEVLFVDYIMNHLRPKGRAGIIVPEGIIFQSGTAHKQLRKNLIEDGLYAVVSLPSGVFQPYSGVKTSILLFNNELAKQNTEILFVKVENDGFDLGATKRPINKNDLPQALEIITAWKNGKKNESKLALYVEKTKIIESGDYNLSGDRYRVAIDYSNAKWPMMELGEVCSFVGGYAFKSNELKNKKHDDNDLPVIKIGNVDRTGSINLLDVQFYTYDSSLEKYLIKQKDILVAMTGATVGKVAVSQYDRMLLNQRVGLIRANIDKLRSDFLKFILLDDAFYNFCQLQAGGGAQGNISPSQIQSYKVPVPSLEIQEQIVTELDGYQNIISGARQIVDSWKPKIDIDPEWQRVKLGELVEIFDSKRRPITKSDRKSGPYPYYGATGVLDYVEGYIFDEPLVLVGEDGAKWGAGEQTAFQISGKSWVNNHAHVLKPLRDRLLDGYLTLYLNQIDLSQYITGVTVPKLNQEKLRDIEIPLAPFEAQKLIVENVESEQVLIQSSQKLIEIYKQKTKDVLSNLWAE